MMELGREWELDHPRGVRRQGGGAQRVKVTVKRVTRTTVHVWLPDRSVAILPWYHFLVRFSASPTQLIREVADEAVKWAIREARS